MDEYLSNKKFKIITATLMLFMLMDISISCIAGARQNERMQKLEARTKIDVFLDKHYPDAVMNKVYHNKINKTRQPKRVI